MSLVSHFSDRLMVMYAGQVAEFGATRQVFDAPLHPYTIGLLEAFPSIRGPRVPLTGIPGSPPDLSRPEPGCRFHLRCPKPTETCAEVAPELAGPGGHPGALPALHRAGSTERSLTRGPRRCCGPRT